MAKSKKVRLSPLKIAVLLFLLLFVPVAVYATKTQTSTESQAYNNDACRARVYVTPYKRYVDFRDMNKTTTYDLYVTQTKDRSCTYDLKVSNLPKGVYAYIQSQITPDAHSTKVATLRVKHNSQVNSGLNDIYVKVTRTIKGDAEWDTDAVAHVEYVVNKPSFRVGDN